MSAKRSFVDTNVLIYAYDSSAGPKHEAASALITGLWEGGDGVISTQVLQEFSAVLSGKLSTKIAADDLASIVRDLLSWDVFVNSGRETLDALSLARKYRLSFWDALIVTAASKSGATVLYSEDLSHNQKISGVLVQNPFAALG